MKKFQLCGWIFQLIALVSFGKGIIMPFGKVFIHAVPDNRGKKDGYYCSLVESCRINGIPKHETVFPLALLPRSGSLI